MPARETLNNLGHTLSRRLLGKHRVTLLRWLRARRDLAKLNQANVVFISYAKAGRTWTRVMISRLYQQAYGLPDNLIIESDNFHRLNAAVPIFLFTMGNYIADRFPIGGRTSPYEGKSLIFLARHPADTAVSFYFHQESRINPMLKDVKRLREGGQRQIFEHFQDSEFGLDHVIDYMNMWIKALPSHERHLLLRYEDLRSRSADELARIARFLGERFSSDQIHDAVQFASFERLQQKERDNFFNNKRLQARDKENPNSFKVRRGKVGGYRDYFTDDQIGWIEGRIRDRLDPRFGYGTPSEAASSP